MDIEILIGNCNGRESHILHEIANWKLLRFHFVRYDFDSCQPTVMKMFFFWIEFIAVSHRFSSFARFFAWFSTANTLRNLPIRYLCEIAICKVHVFQFCKSIIGGHQMNGLFLFSFNFTKKNAHWKELKRSWLRMDSLFVVCLFVRLQQTTGQYSHAAICVDRRRSEAASFFLLLCFTHIESSHKTH